MDSSRLTILAILLALGLGSCSNAPKRKPDSISLESPQRSSEDYRVYLGESPEEATEFPRAVSCAAHRFLSNGRASRMLLEVFFQIREQIPCTREYSYVHIAGELASLTSPRDCGIEKPKPEEHYPQTDQDAVEIQAFVMIMNQNSDARQLLTK